MISPPPRSNPVGYSYRPRWARYCPGCTWWRGRARPVPGSSYRPGAILGLDAVRAASEGEIEERDHRNSQATPSDSTARRNLVTNDIDVSTVSTATRVFAGVRHRRRHRIPGERERRGGPGTCRDRSTTHIGRNMGRSARDEEYPHRPGDILRGAFDHDDRERPLRG